MVTTTGSRSGEQLPQKTLEYLVTWQLAKEQAKRRNRNLLQYAAGLTAVLGIIAGTTSLQLVARSLDNSIATSWRFRSWNFENVVMSACVIAALVLLLLVIYTFFRRLRSDAEADKALGNLIVEMPQWFQPKED